MSKLILIKHAAPVKDPTRPTREWPLSDAGRSQAAKLATMLQSDAVKIDAVVTSDEPKAHETGEIIATAFGLQVDVGDDLHEHDRENVPVMATREFISSMAFFFKESNRLVLGRETSDEAAGRIERAIEAVMESHAGKDVAIVTHGTVIALFASDLLREDPFVLWRRLGLPSFIVMDWETRKVERVVDKID